MKEGNPDDAETQPIADGMPECSPSPTQHLTPFIESQWRLERGASTANLGARLEDHFEAVASDGEENEEAPEEEAPTDDEVIDEVGGVCVEVGFKDNETVQILSDDECVMSPGKTRPLVMFDGSGDVHELVDKPAVAPLPPVEKQTSENTEKKNTEAARDEKPEGTQQKHAKEASNSEPTVPKIPSESATAKIAETLEEDMKSDLEGEGDEKARKATFKARKCIPLDSTHTCA